jgi:hypothetical protein
MRQPTKSKFIPSKIDNRSTWLLKTKLGIKRNTDTGAQQKNIAKPLTGEDRTLRNILNGFRILVMIRRREISPIADP